MNKMIQSGQTLAQIRQVFRTISSPRLPMHWLDGWLLTVIDKPSIYVVTEPNDVPTDQQIVRINEGVERMMAGEPLAYLLGKCEFWSREFVVNRHTLIPRPDTERLVEMVMAFAKPLPAGRLLDLGTGSGCIGITLACELADWQVVLVDNSPQALEVAKTNAQQHHVNAQCQLSHWYDALTGTFDVIVSNPPYIRSDDEHLVGLQHEPITALVAFDDGLSDIKQIIGGAKHHLNAGGWLAIEHGYHQGALVFELFVQAGFTQVQTIKDYGGNDRLTMGILPTGA